MLHTGGIGKRVAISSLTGRLRHFFGPDALAIGLYGQSMLSQGEKGYIGILKGKYAGLAKEYTEGSPITSFDSSIIGEFGVEVVELYYTGSINRLDVRGFEAFSGLSYEGGLSIGFGGSLIAPSVSVGAGVLFSKNYDMYNNYSIGVTSSISIGTGGIGIPIYPGISIGGNFSLQGLNIIE